MTKEEVLTACAAELTRRRADVNAALAALQTDKESESKSSAGDKYETGRAMLHQEENKHSLQLARIGALEKQLYFIRQRKSSETVGAGSLVRTERGWFLLGLGLGKLKIDQVFVYGLSLDAPLATQLLGKRVGEGGVLDLV